MPAKTTTARAITAFLARRTLRVITVIAIIIGLVFLIAIWALATQVSSWWWLLLIPLMIIVAAFLALRWVLNRLINGVYRPALTTEQKASLETFTGKISKLVEARSTPLPIFALLTLWDIIRRRDATTVRSLIDDSKGLKKDFLELEKLFDK